MRLLIHASTVAALALASATAHADTLTWVGGDGTVRFVYAAPPPGIMFIFK